MERLTEYEWEQRKRDRESQMRYSLNAVRLADFDRQAFEIEHEVGNWPEWSEIVSKRKANGWVLADYGQSGSWFLMSGYFKRAKSSP